MPEEVLQAPDLNEKFEQLVGEGNLDATTVFLNNQNISDVAELIYEFPQEELNIISQLSIHRASSVFKILELSTQKRINTPE